jgi:uncharacterized protein
MSDRLVKILARLTALKPELEERFGISEVSVFGSFARDKAGPDSDLDLLIDFSPEARPTYFSLALLDQRLAEALGVRVKTVHRDGLNPRLAPFIEAELVRA